jgi:hypothetical protein
MDFSAELKKHYPEEYPEIAAIFAKNDPLDLQTYDLEIFSLFGFLQGEKDKETIYKHLLDIFQESFGEETIRGQEKRKLKKIADDIAAFYENRP